MTDQTTLDRVREIVAEQLDAPPCDILLESRLVDDLGADSIDLVDISMSLEDAFGVGLTDSEIEEIDTIADAVRVVDRALAEVAA